MLHKHRSAVPAKITSDILETGVMHSLQLQCSATHKLKHLVWVRKSQNRGNNECLLQRFGGSFMRVPTWV